MDRVDISLLGRDYSLACQPSERANLLAAAKLVEQRMQAASQTKNLSYERMAVMAAMQIALELLGMRAANGSLGDVTVGAVKERLDAMHGLLDQVMEVAA